MVGMKTVSALDVRRRFGQLLDEAAAGERIVIERAGQPRAALVPLEDLEHLDPARALARKREALEMLGRMARLRPAGAGFDAARTVRETRDQREAHIDALVNDWRGTDR
jgi:prevent-host-death family protein